MRALTNIICDPVQQEGINYTWFDRYILHFIRDERDLPFIYFTLKIMFFLIPLAILLYTPIFSGWWWLFAMIAYSIINILAFIGRFALMFHCTAHRILFKKDFNYMNYFLPWCIAPFFGHMAHTYYSHHIGMHHVENNLQDDESTTMTYQRDSFLDFLLYYYKFMQSGVCKLFHYFKKRNRGRLAFRAIGGHISFILFSFLMCLLDWEATLGVFVFPFFFYRFIAMMGNWAQHAFVDPDDPGNSYKNSITCINTKYNWQCWNDGYHISHHEKPTMHWTEYPEYFRKTTDKYIVNNAVVFEEIDYVKVWLCLMVKRYEYLADHFVNIGDRFATDAEVMAFLKTRVKRF